MNLVDGILSVVMILFAGMQVFLGVVAFATGGDWMQHFQMAGIVIIMYDVEEIRRKLK